MSEAFRWWLVLLVVGILLLPLCLAMFRRLPDRGYALSKPFGLVFLGFTFWLLNSIHIAPNSVRGTIGVLVVLTAISAIFVYRERDPLIDWLRDHWQYIVGVEVLFLVVFMVAVWLRSLVGQIQGTEQPMDLMFLNAVRHAEYFPPKDPWLSGHTVAYYYFGYLLVDTVGRLAAVAPDVEYNIGLAMIATMALVGAAGLVYNLVQMREDSELGGDAHGARRAGITEATPASARQLPGGAGGSSAAAAFNWRPPVFGLAAGLMLVIMGNLVWVFQFASAYGFGGNGLYKWVDVSGLTAGEPRHSWYPSQFFSFFNASRIYPLNHEDFRAITEFPMFSFLLGDLHPHVMALPLVLLVIGAALTFFRSPEPLDITFWLERPLVLLATAIMIGGLAFLNTWDIATMAFVVVAAAFVGNFTRVRAITPDLFVQTATFAVPLMIVAVLAYLPFYVNFTSQANGIGAVVANDGITVPATRPFHLLLFWGPLFIVVIPFVLARLLAARARVTRALVAASFAPAGAVILGWVLVFAWEKARGSDKLGVHAGSLFSQIGDRGSAWLSAAFVAAVLAAALLALWLELTSDDGRDERQSVIFTLTITVTAMLLILGCEFFYVGDVFNSRMNTVFKLYYQAWLLLALAGGFSLYYLSSRWRFSFPRERQYRIGWAVAVAVVLAGAALYPLGGGFNRTHDERGKRASGELAGIAHFNPDDLKGIGWLDERAQDQNIVIAEAVGNDYTEAGRISSATGVPAILGWGGHEDQWHGDKGKARAGRFEDVERLYKSPEMASVNPILEKYGVTYVYVGPLERTKYPEGLAKFQSMPVAFQSGAVTIYRASNLTGEVSAQ